jgi:hypothetical protein
VSDVHRPSELGEKMGEGNSIEACR